MAHLLSLATLAQPLQVGVGKVDITPEEPVALCGYSNPDRRISEGIHDRLYARAVAFSGGSGRLVLLSCDLAGFASVPLSHFQKEILARHGLRPEQLLLCGTHTHSGPMLTLSASWPHPNNIRYTGKLKAKLVEAVGQALQSSSPGRIGAGTGHSPVAANRRLPLPPDRIQPGGSRVTMDRNPGGPVDREVQVLKVVQTGGAPVAALFGYACHSRSLRSGNRLVSGDILGIAEQYAEKNLGAGVVAPAFAGTSGDVDPWYVVDRFNPQSGWIPETELMGKLLGTEVVHVFRNIKELSAAGSIRTQAERIALPGRNGGAPDPASRAPDRHVLLSAAAIGDIAFLGFDCEVLVEIGLAIKAKSPFRQTLPITHCNGGGGYLPPAHRYAERGYEVDISGFAPEASGIVVERALALLHSLRRSPTPLE